MACFFPREIRVKRKNVTKMRIARECGTLYDVVRVPCGRCAGCLRDRQNEWAFRILLESEDYIGRTYFIRLSYSPEFLPLTSDGKMTLRKEDGSRFIKYLRNHGVACRYFLCGEYGDLGRPHMHVILFTEKRYERYELFKIVEDAWSFQDSAFSKSRTLIGSTNCKYFKWQDAQYVGKYTTKDIERSYVGIEPPFHLQSRKPALGDNYFRTHASVIRSSSLFTLTDIRGFVHPIPRVFLEKLYDYRTLQLHSLEMQALNEARERLLMSRYENVFGYGSYRAGKFYLNLQKNVRKIKYSRLLQRRNRWYTGEDA